MKRFGMFLFALLFFIPAVSSASTLKQVQIGWHSTIGAGYAQGDSSFVYRGTGLENSAQQIDTSQTINIRQFALPPAIPVVTASDTMSVFMVNLFPVGTSPTVAADTLAVLVQVSMDNVSWTTAVATGPKISPVNGGVAVLEMGTTNCFNYVIRHTMGGVTQSVFSPLGTGPTANQIYGLPYMRLIVQGDHTGQYDATITGFVD